MKSDNPNSGFYEATTSRTIDCKGGNPTCNQGGMVIVEQQAIPIEGNGQRPSHKGNGWNESDKMFTLNTTEQHAVAQQSTYQKVTGPLMANSHPGSYTGQDAFSDMLIATDYTVRRLTPMECARLQGFDDDWTDGTVDENPDKQSLAFWMQVWLEHWAIIGRGKGIKKPKTEKEVKRWLASEPSDSDKYKLWGNGIALPCAFYVFEGIKKVLDGESAI
jgi:DNA (cytosine-5)-methyltransferase 1